MPFPFSSSSLISPQGYHWLNKLEIRQLRVCQCIPQNEPPGANKKEDPEPQSGHEGANGSYLHSQPVTETGLSGYAMAKSTFLITNRCDLYTPRIFFNPYNCLVIKSFWVWFPLHYSTNMSYLQLLYKFTKRCFQIFSNTSNFSDNLNHVLLIQT